MPFPNQSSKYKHPSVLTGKDMINYRRSAGIFPRVEPPESVLVCLETSLPKRMRRKYPYRKRGRIVGDLLLLKRAHGKVGVMVNLGVGAPAVVGLCEELIAWGVKNFVLMSWAGSLQPDLADGDVVIAQRAIRDEGTSHHYLAAEKYVESHPGLTEKLQAAIGEEFPKASVGTTWTTDAPYRETDVEVMEYRKEGVMTVEMETAALFALGQYRGVNTAATFVVGDKLINSQWLPPSDLKAVNAAFNGLYACVVDLLMGL